MIHKIKQMILVALSLLAVATPALVPAVAMADTKADLCSGAELDISGNTKCKNNGSTDVSNLVTDVVNILSAIVGVVAVIMIIVGGFKYITSGGDSTKVASAKNTIIYAVVGLIIVALAQVIVRFVLAKTP